MINIDYQINAVQRELSTRIIDAGQARVANISQSYKATVEDVWDACTNPERIPRWFLPITGDLKEGGRYQLEGNASGTIERCDPPHSFSVTWEFGGKVSWLEVRMTDDGDGRTRLMLEHVALVEDELWEQFGPGAVGVGWDMALMGLAEHLEGASPVDPAESEAWMVSEEGKQFVALSSEKWADASIAAGTEESQARAAAERTTAFYTGAAPAE